MYWGPSSWTYAKSTIISLRCRWGCCPSFSACGLCPWHHAEKECFRSCCTWKQYTCSSKAQVRQEANLQFWWPVNVPNWCMDTAAENIESKQAVQRFTLPAFFIMYVIQWLSVATLINRLWKLSKAGTVVPPHVLAGEGREQPAMLLVICPKLQWRASMLHMVAHSAIQSYSNVVLHPSENQQGKRISCTVLWTWKGKTQKMMRGERRCMPSRWTSCAKLTHLEENSTRGDQQQCPVSLPALNPPWLLLQEWVLL